MKGLMLIINVDY